MTVKVVRSAAVAAVFHPLVFLKQKHQRILQLSVSHCGSGLVSPSMINLHYSSPKLTTHRSQGL